MQRSIGSVSLIVSGCIFFSLATGLRADPTADRATVERQIRESIESWRLAANRGDAAGEDKIWAAGVQGWFPSAAEFEIPAAFGGAVEGKALRSTYTVKINEVLVSSDLAVVRDTWEETVHAPDGRTAHRIIQSFEVWQPQASGEWKISRWISAPGPWQREKA
jgi:ketosteroid isomerase-like protein